MRKLSGMVVIVMVALLLAACGSDSDEKETPTVAPTIEPTATSVVQEATPPVIASTMESSPMVSEASPASSIGVLGSPAASPATTLPQVVTSSPEAVTGEIASPVAEASPATAMLPVITSSPEAIAGEIATPVTEASPVASTPAAVAVIAGPASETSPAASPEATVAAMVALNGRVELMGAENSTWVMSDNGCTGLGGNADLAAGHQVVIRDEAGVIVGVTTLEASGETNTCTWTFTIEVPESNYYAVSIPMHTELVFSHDEIEHNNGAVTIVLR